MSNCITRHCREFRGHIKQRFRYSQSGRHYYLTQTKRGSTAVWIRQADKPIRGDACNVVEQWRKADAGEAAEAINDLAATYKGQPSFEQFFVKAQP